MRYKLSQFPSISPQNLLLLRQAGVENSDQLLALLALPKDRDVLARQTGIDIVEINRLAGISDLIRVKGVGLVMADFLVKSGIAGNIQSLIESMSDPECVEQKIHAFRRVHNPTGIPSINKLKPLVEEASELRPKLLLSAREDGASFRQEIFSRQQKEGAHSRRFGYQVAGILVAAIAILYALTQIYLNNLLNAKSIPGDPLNQLTVEAARVFLQANNISLILVSTLLVTFMLALFLVYDGLSSLLNTWLAVWLFDHPQYRDFYRSVTSIDLAKQVRGMRWATLIFAVLAVVLTLYAWFLMQAQFELDVLAQRIAPLVILGGALIGVSVSLPLFRFYLSNARNNHDPGSIKRYMVYQLAKVLMIPIMVVLLTQVTLPAVFYLHRSAYLNWIVPPAHAKVAGIRVQVANFPVEDPTEIERQDELLSAIDEEDQNLEHQGLPITPEDTSLTDLYIPAALNMVAWTALTAYFMLFFLPYLILGGWKRGIFYILILGLSFNLENLLTHYSPTWFSLPPGSAGSTLFIAFFIFANALFFDWLFDALTEKNKPCPSCRTNLPEEALYCSNCGFVQR